MKSTKTKLISSVAVLLICFAMLIGSTFAWFTDSASTGVNKIQAGNLDVQLLAFTGSGYHDVNEIPNTPLSLFGSGETANANNPSTLWEPGKTQVAYLRIKNNGNLDLKYSVVVEVVNPEDSNNLYQVMKYEIFPNATNANPVTAWTGPGTAVSVGNNATQAKDVTLKKDSEHNFALAVHMDETAGNEYKNGKVQFYIHVYATQLASEFDSFGNQYDVNAKYPVELNARVSVGNENKTTSEITVSTAEKDSVTGEPVAKVTIPDGVAVTGSNLVIKIEEVATPSNASVAVTSNSKTLEVKLDGLNNAENEDSGKPIKVEKYIEAGLGNGVALKHISSNGTITPFTKASSADSVTNNQFYYDNSTGLLTFKSKSFSPFVIEYPKDSWNDHMVEALSPNENGVYEISTAAQFAWFANHINNNSSQDGYKAELLNSIDLSEYVWEPIVVNGYVGQGNITIDGKGNSIKGLNQPLISRTWAGTPEVTIRNLTIDSANIEVDINNDSDNIGVGAFIGYAEATPRIIIDNCHLVNSRVAGGNWCGGFVGYAAGYDVVNNGPVFEEIKIANSTVKKTIILSEGSVGGIIGHATGNNATRVEITNCVISGNTITSFGDKTDKAGSIMGTVGCAGVNPALNRSDNGVYVNATEVSNNVVKSNNALNDKIYGRQGNEDGKLVVDNVVEDFTE